MNNTKELFEDIQDNIDKIPFITINEKTGIILRKYHWTIKSQINLIREALNNVVERDIFILGEHRAEYKYICMESTLNNISNYLKIKRIVEDTLNVENERVRKQIEQLALFHSKGDK